ncbi:MAG: zeta toxin family protein [Clostridia bacterium]|nr:zeta toxin family protein [Clostridia bacterium]
MENFEIIKNTKLFKNVTKKDNNYINFLKQKIGSHINKDIAEQMLNFALSKKQSKKISKQIKKDSLKNKTPNQNPIINIVISQTGAGKTSVSNLIQNSQLNTIFIDTDIYKKYNPLTDLILKYCPTYFGYLTGLDCYLHRDYIYDYAVKNKYNILIEVTPSTKDGLFNIDFNLLQSKGYKIILNVLAVSKINSLISVHERYENQINQNSKTPKLTDINRAVDSFVAVEQLLNNIKFSDNVIINLYKRIQDVAECVYQNVDKNNYVKNLNILQNEDKVQTLQTLQSRINSITKSMQNRNASPNQILQFEQIQKIINQDV